MLTKTRNWQSKCIDFFRLAGLGVGSHDSEASFKTDSKMASLASTGRDSPGTEEEQV